MIFGPSTNHYSNTQNKTIDHTFSVTKSGYIDQVDGTFSPQGLQGVQDQECGQSVL